MNGSVKSEMLERLLFIMMGSFLKKIMQSRGYSTSKDVSFSLETYTTVYLQENSPVIL